MEAQRHRTLYYGKDIVKHYDRDIEKGDVGFKTWEEREDTITPIRFCLEDVFNWQIYADPFETYEVQKAGKTVLRVQLTCAGGRDECHIIEDLDVFDMLMEAIYAKENRKP